MKLEECAEAIATDIAFWMEGIIDPGYPMDKLGQLAFELGTKLRALGIILLVTKADSDGFQFNLIRSGRAWRTYLKRAQAEQAQEDHHFCTGRSDPLVDCIATGQFDLALEISGLLPNAWRKGHEYEDDYCFGRLLQILCMPLVDKTLAEPVIRQWETYLDDDDSPRLAVIQSLLNQDQDDFNERFQDLIFNYHAEIEKNKQRGQLEEPHVIAQRRVFVEGLAILRLAEKQGLATEREYDLCPFLARLPRTRPLPEDTDPAMADWLK